MVPCRTGNYTQTVSCCDETRWCHALPVISSEVEKSPGEQIPADVRCNAAMSGRKPFTCCFPPTGIYENIPHLLLLPRSFAVAQDDRWEAGRNLQNTVGLCQTGNYMRTVSCCDETRWCHVGQETIRGKFPMEVKHGGGHALPVISSEAKRSREISLRKVPCRNETQRSYAG